ncbi:hypothetical protein LDENG_00111530 [Lucifuga dentata]|nr:hypothetical protein LDENG_00111530 [Lucifuga dentata]
MYGFINSCLKSLVTERFGLETWDKLSCLPGVQDAFMTYQIYDDVLTLRLVQEACSLLGVNNVPEGPTGDAQQVFWLSGVVPL